MEEQLGEVLDNLLGMLLLEGSYEIEEADDNFNVLIETKDAGRLIGARGESLDALQLLVNQMVSRKVGEESPARNADSPDKATPLRAGASVAGGYKRVVIDVEGWRKQKEGDLQKDAENWGKQVLEKGEPLELEPMSPWQRRIVHMSIEGIKGVVSESAGEGRDRHIIIKIKDQKSKIKNEEHEEIEKPNAEASEG